MDKIFRLTVLIILALMFFIMGTMMLFQSSKDFKDLEKFTGQVERIWTDVSKNIKGRPSDILLFKIKGLEQIVGIFHNTIDDYNFYLERIKPKDVVTIYFDRQGGKTSEGYNLHTYQLEKDSEVLLDKAERCKMYRKFAFVFYGLGLIYSNFPIWFYRKRMKT